MMKKLAKAFLGLIAAVAMLFTGLALPSSAVAADTTYTLTINGTETGHTYEAYQVFSGKLSENKLSDIQWGSGVAGEKMLNALKVDTTFGDDDSNAFKDVTTASGVAEKLSAYQTDSAEAKEFAKVVGANLKDAAGTSQEGTSTEQGKYPYTISNLAAGYYLVKDKNNSVPEGDDAYTDFILKIVKNTTATPKSDVPTVEKKVKDVNDSTGDTSDWQDSADHDINDTIEYKLTGDLPSNYDSYTKYAYKFTDTLSKGLTLNKDSIKVYAVKGAGEQQTKTEIKKLEAAGDDGYTVATANYTGTGDKYEGGTVLTIDFADLKQAAAATAGETLTIDKDTKIVVEYSATLNGNAVIGSAGNPNKVDLTFSNNPGGEGTGTTPEDTVIVFTYKVIVNKVKSDNSALAGAKFKLEKKIKGQDGAEDTWKELGEKEATGDGSNVFTWEGLDDGDYRLTETQTPDGYNSIDPIEFTVTAEHKVVWDGTDDALTSLNGNNASGLITFTPSLPDGSLSTNVVNKSGSELPETGGIGTTILYVAGAVCVAAAGVWFGLRRRNSVR